MKVYHQPVLLSEVISFLNIQPNHWYIDCNLGGGGHTGEILKRGGRVLGIDLDPDAISEVAKNFNLTIQKRDQRLFAESKNLIIYQSNFTEIKSIVKQFNIQKVDGILFDLGVSSYQLETKDRGFSFNLNAPLDMRMDKQSLVTATDLINGLHESELAELFFKLGEERFAKRIAKKIVEHRQLKKIETTDQLAKIILAVRPKNRLDRTHPATRVFQALRIAINDELNSLKIALPETLDVLNPNGRLVVLTFHSLEDRIVKNFFKDQEKKSLIEVLNKKPITPTEEEVLNNPRSRSGKLRVAEKLLSL
ncbi:16S rRNA (cytosine(1402)-N(4))-methyltransferase RsmH [Candidatus Daviesbacteria bacterium]|nr:16S rRNA (cytosine(1402)-N(4))-methyltransferase RsmH [Candidatus Daviesbacteria bacterium]